MVVQPWGHNMGHLCSPLKTFRYSTKTCVKFNDSRSKPIINLLGSSGDIPSRNHQFKVDVGPMKFRWPNIPTWTPLYKSSPYLSWKTHMKNTWGAQKPSSLRKLLKIKKPTWHWFGRKYLCSPAVTRRRSFDSGSQLKVQLLSDASIAELLPHPPTNNSKNCVYMYIEVHMYIVHIVFIYCIYIYTYLV